MDCTPGGYSGPRGISDEHVCFPLAQGPVEQPVPRPARRRLTCQTDMMSEDDLSADEEVVTDSKFHDTVVGGPALEG